MRAARGSARDRGLGRAPQLNAARALQAAPPSSSRRASASTMPAAIDPGRAGRRGRPRRRRPPPSRAGARDDRGAAGHRLQHRHPEALVERGVDDAARAAVEASKLGVRNPAEPADAVPARSTPPQPRAPTTRSSTPRRRAASARRARFFRGSSVPTASTYSPSAAGPSDEKPARRRSARRDPLLGDAEQLDDLAACELRDRDERSPRADAPRQRERAVEPVQRGKVSG